MKKLLQHLLIILALGLCGLCTWQWSGQVQQHKALASVSQTSADQAAQIMSATNSVAILDQQLAQMDARLTELRSVVQSNRTEIAAGRSENQRLTGALTQANDNVRQQNESLKVVVAQRDAFLQRLNDAIQDRNAVVEKYNALVKQIEDAKPRTEPAGKK
ncbi:MAG: hypothetical protein WCG79_07470 [Verrucomicrobiota bacterium]